MNRSPRTPGPGTSAGMALPLVLAVLAAVVAVLTAYRLLRAAGDGIELGVREALFNVLGPIGQPFRLSPERPNTLLIGGGVGIPPMVYIADRIRQMFAGRGREMPANNLRPAR